MKNPTDKTASTAKFVLGHSERELERLSTQARRIRPITWEFFIEAGIVPGMRILDGGSGSGDVAFLAADLAGDKGTVVGEWLRAVAEIAENLAPAMEKFGVATSAEVDLATLAQRMTQEVAETNSVIIGRSEIGAWSRV